MLRKYQTIEIRDSFKGLIDGIPVIESAFKFRGFNNEIHPHHRCIEKWIKRILRENGIALNVIEFRTVEGFLKNCPDSFVVYDNLSNYAKDQFSRFNVKSDDKNIYRLIQDTEMGRGWAVIFINDDVLYQEHRDTVRDYMLSEDFIKTLIPTIDYEYRCE